jgi:integrase
LEVITGHYATRRGTGVAALRKCPDKMRFSVQICENAHHVYTPAEMQRILVEAQDWPRPLHMPVLLDYATGMRRGELLGLMWKHVDLDRASLSVVQTLRETRAGVGVGLRPKTKSGQRQIAISPTIVEALRQHKADQSKNKLALGPDYSDLDMVFPMEDGNFWKPSLFSNNFRSLRLRLGLDGTFHDVRHTHATELLRMGVHPKIVSERLGHASVQITLDRYSHVLPDMQRAVAMQLDDALIAIQEDVGL